MQVMIPIQRLERHASCEGLAVLVGDRMVVLRIIHADPTEEMTIVEVKGIRRGVMVVFDTEKPMLKIERGGTERTEKDLEAEEYAAYEAEAVDLVTVMHQVK